VDIEVHIGLPGGIAPEEVALHRGAELEMPMDELKRVDVAEDGAEQRNLICEVSRLSKEGAMDEIGVHVIVDRALESTVSIDYQTKLGRADGEIVGEIDFARPQFDGAVEVPKS
jgi:hypothetical protein